MTLEERIRAELNPAQAEAVLVNDRPQLILAGAGSGKTRVLTWKIAWLIGGLDRKPWEIVALTFTNKAAREMRERAEKLMGQSAPEWMGTFHGICARILRREGGHLGYGDAFTIYDDDDQRKVVSEACATLAIKTPTPDVFRRIISSCKNKDQGPDDLAAAFDPVSKNAAKVFELYQRSLKAADAMDFDDLLLNVLDLFRRFPEREEAWRKRFSYILIDEYQDTNHAQYILAHALAQRRKNICVVGDPDQSIYAWRGADIQNILDFEKDYPDAKIVRLEQNYRSSKRILRIASKLIAKNTQRKDKTLWTENDEGELAQLFFCQDEHDESTTITQQLRALHDKGGYDWNKMAIFYRMNALSRVMEDGLRKAGVPYQIARGTEFYNRKEIKDALAYLRIVSNPSDELSLDRIANVPARGLSDATLKQMSTYAIANGHSLWKAMSEATSVPAVSARAASAAGQFVTMVTKWRTRVYGALQADRISPSPGEGRGEGLAARSEGDRHPNPLPEYREREPEGSEERKETGKTEETGEQGSLFGSAEDDPFGPSDPAMLDAIEPDDSGSSDEAMDPAPAEIPQPTHRRMTVRDIVEMVIHQSGLEAYLRKIGGDELDELHNVEELISSAAEFDKENPQGSLDDFLAQISLVSDADHMKGTGGAVTLMTLHAAKGLEFPVVAMIGLEEGILPHSRAREKPSDLEEERRLCFVGITRAEERLILSKAARRTIRGVSERTIPSPFLHELPQEDLNVTDRTGVESWSPPRRGGAPTQRAARRGGIEPEATEDSFRRPPTGAYSHLRPGQTVRHPMFGIGRIREIEETGEQRTRAVVQFNQVGQKTFYLEYVRLEVIE